MNGNNGGASIRLTQDQVYPVVCQLWRQQGRDMELQQRQQAEHGTEAIVVVGVMPALVRDSSRRQQSCSLVPS